MSNKKKPVKKKASARGLGRGLSALMADVSVPAEAELETKSAPAKSAKKISKSPAASKGASSKSSATAPQAAGGEQPSKQIQFISISRLDRNPDQPRKMFNETDLAELTSSIAEKGVLQPILVRPIPPSQRSKSDNAKADFQIVAGERRWQASLKAGLDAMPVLIRELSDQEVLEIGVVENVQRADLNPMEEARAYRALMTEFGRTQQDVSEAIGKSRSHIANLLRMLDLPLQIQRWLELGKLSLGHAKAIMTMPDPIETAEMILRDGLSVRATEAYVKRYKEGTTLNPTETYRDNSKDPNLANLEKQLTDMLGLKVLLKHKGPGGELKIKYRNGDQLEDVMRRLRG
jgi:ParB family chromosome partitioning protein